MTISTMGGGTQEQATPGFLPNDGGRHRATGGSGPHRWLLKTLRLVGLAVLAVLVMTAGLASPAEAASPSVSLHKAKKTEIYIKSSKTYFWGKASHVSAPTKRGVRLQVKKGKSWVTVAKAKVRRGGLYKLSFKAPAKTGTYRYRVGLYASTAKHAHRLDTSPVKKIKVIKKLVFEAVEQYADSGAPAQWEWSQLDGDYCPDAASMDADRNGYVEDLWWDRDNDCVLDTRYWNTTGGDDFLEALALDTNRDGWWDVSFLDTDQRLGLDYYWIDANFDGQWDTPQVATPIVDGGFSIMQDFGVFEMNTGGSVETCPGRIVCMRPGI